MRLLRPWIVVACCGMAAGLGLVARAADSPGTKPARSGVDSSEFDRAVRPQDDLFRHVNGGWIGRVQIPSDRGLFGSFVQLLEKSEADLHAIIEEAAKSDAPAGSEARKIGDLFASFMDEEQVEGLGAKSVKADLLRIEAAGGKADFLRLLAEASTRRKHRAVRSLRQHRRQAVGPLYREPRPGRYRSARRVVLSRSEVSADSREVPDSRREDPRARGSPGAEGDRGQGVRPRDAVGQPPLGSGQA